MGAPRAITDDPIDRVCPTCHAEAGKRCKSVGAVRGKPMRTVHSERKRGAGSTRPA